MSEHDKLLKAMAEVTGLALDGHHMSIAVHGASRDEFLSFVHRYDATVEDVATGPLARAVVWGEEFYPNVEMVLFLAKGAALVGETGPLVAEEESEDPRDEHFDREAGWYEGWKGPEQ